MSRIIGTIGFMEVEEGARIEQSADNGTTWNDMGVIDSQADLDTATRLIVTRGRSLGLKLTDYRIVNDQKIVVPPTCY